MCSNKTCLLTLLDRLWSEISVFELYSVFRKRLNHIYATSPKTRYKVSLIYMKPNEMFSTNKQVLFTQAHAIQRLFELEFEYKRRPMTVFLAFGRNGANKNSAPLIQLCVHLYYAKGKPSPISVCMLSVLKEKVVVPQFFLLLRNK